MKTLFSLLPLLLCSILVVAQNDHLSIGLKMGLNQSYVRLANEDDIHMDININKEADITTGWQAGGYIAYKINKIELLQELLYTQKGYHGSPRTLNTLDAIERTNYRFDYISLPTLVRYYLAERFYLGIGTENAFLVNATSMLLGARQDLLDEDESIPPFIPSINRWDFGVIGEIAYQYERMGFQLRYNHGISSLYSELQLKDENENLIGTQKSRLGNRSWQASITFDIFNID